MKLGFLTACLPSTALSLIVPWAAQAGFDALEVAAWPELGDRPFTATHVRVASMVLNATFVGYARA